MSKERTDARGYLSDDGDYASSGKNSSFVGRVEELEVIRQAIESSERSTGIFLISGPSGIGKTRLLYEIPSYCQDLNDVIFTKLVDCYETSAHVPFSIESRLAKELGPLEKFDQSFADWVRSRSLPAQAQSTVFEAMRESFLHDYNSQAQRQRLVLRFDTVEVAQRSDLWERIIELAPHLDNTVILLAGQGIDAAQSEIERRYRTYNARIQTLPLLGLGQEETSDFVKKRAPNLFIDSSLQEKIRVLTDGRPVLLSLAVEWLSRSVPIDELEALSLADIDALHPEKLASIRQEVERALVEGILKLTDLADQAVLQMAWVYRRFDIHILSVLLGITIQECRQLLVHLQGLPFTRVLPNGVCVLHDNVRDLVERYDWPIVDPNGTYRLELDFKIVKYYNGLISRQKRKTKRLHQRATSDKGHTQKETQRIFSRLAEAETERWIYEAERLFYKLRADPEAGVTHFANLFDEATEAVPYYRELLVSEVRSQDEKWYERLSSKAGYIVKFYLAKALASATQVETAHEGFLSLLDHKGATDKQRVDLLIQLGNTAVRLGKTTEGEEYFNKALELSQSLEYPLLVTQSEHALAWLRRLQGHWDEAARCYRSALQKASAIQAEDQRLKMEAWLKNGLGYIEHLLGHNAEAEKHCLDALELWQHLGVPLQLGSIYSTLGEVMTGQDRYTEALHYYNQSLNIFQEQRAWEWQTIVYHQMSYSSWCTRDLERAWEYLLRSRKLAAEHKISRELPAIFHRWGLLVLDDYHDFVEATKHFERGVEESRRHQNAQMLLENLVALVEIAYRYVRDYALMEQREAEMRSVIQTQQSRYLLLEGRLERILAEAAFDQSDYDKALEHYIRAIPMIAQHGGYGRYKLSTELLFLESRLTELPTEVCQSWCNRMRAEWASLSISQTHPELLNLAQKYLKLTGPG